MSMNIDSGCKVARESAGNMTMASLETMAARAEKIVCIVSERLTSVTRSEPPSVAGCDKTAEQEQYPPLFSRIRELTESVNRSLSGIENIIRRVEL